jgi:polysaccharide biosynthesis protein PslH
VRIAIVNPYPVHGRAVGGVTRVNSLVRFLAARHDVTVLAHSTTSPAGDSEAVHDLSQIGVVQSLFPRPRASLRARLDWAIGRHPYFVGYNRNPALAEALDALHRRAALDVVHVEFAYLAPLLRGLDERPARVLAEQETMSLALDRLGEVPFVRRSLYESYLRFERGKVRRFEASVLPTFHRVYGITPREAEHLREASRRSVDVLPHVVCPQKFAPRAQDGAATGVLFVGNYGHRPNRHGLLWFTDKVWPLVRRTLPGTRFDVVGPGLSRETVRRLEGDDVRVHGHVDDLVHRYQSAGVFVNPIWSGGGMRGKVLEAFACGLAVVSTTVGMEGIAAEPGRHFLLADDEQSFAHAVARYVTDRALATAHGRAARDLTERLYDPSVVFARLEQDYQAAVEERARRKPVA